jgi:tRNA threonylcarbamoyladenosine biosynthesis protein TsaB
VRDRGRVRDLEREGLTRHGQTSSATRHTATGADSSYTLPVLTLALVTCGPQLEVALAGEALAATSVVRLAGVSPRSSLLLAAVDLLLEDAAADPTKVESIVVTRGPGSFTGIRAGLATAAGLALATGAEAVAYDSLLAQAARCLEEGEVWAAQPGRRGEVYAQRFAVTPVAAPVATGELRVMRIDELAALSPWVAAEALDLGPVHRASAAATAAEGLLRLAALGVPPLPLEPLYVEGPPIHAGKRQ